MAKTVNEAMTAIADTIRHNAMNNDDPIDRPLYLDDMPDAISQVRNGGYYKGYQQGYEEGEEIGWSSGWVDNETMVVGELHKPVRKVEDYTSVECDPVDSVGMIQYIDENLSKVYENGQKSEWDKFWDALQANGTRTDYDYAFAKWKSEYIRPKYKVIPTAGSCAGLFQQNYTLKAVEKEYFDLSKIPISSTAAYMCNSCGFLVTFEDIGIPALNTYSATWRLCNNLQTIEVVRSNENTVFTNTFQNDTSLENITIEGVIGNDFDIHWSPLSKESIVNIIDALGANKTGKTLTLNKEAVNNAFGINVDDESTYPDGSEFYNLRHSKDNWTFSYMNA